MGTRQQQGTGKAGWHPDLLCGTVPVQEFQKSLLCNLYHMYWTLLCCQVVPTPGLLFFKRRRASVHYNFCAFLGEAMTAKMV